MTIPARPVSGTIDILNIDTDSAGKSRYGLMPIKTVRCIVMENNQTKKKSGDILAEEKLQKWLQEMGLDKEKKEDEIDQD